MHMFETESQKASSTSKRLRTAQKQAILPTSCQIHSTTQDAKSYEIIWTSTNYIASICVMVSKIISNKYDIWKTNTVIFLTCNSAQQKYVDTRYLKQIVKETVSFLVSKQFPKQRTSIWKHQFGKPVGKLVSNINFFQLFTSFHCLFTVFSPESQPHSSQGLHFPKAPVAQSSPPRPSTTQRHPDPRFRCC